MSPDLQKTRTRPKTEWTWRRRKRRRPVEPGVQAEDATAAPAEERSTSLNDPALVATVLDVKSEECVGAGSTDTVLTGEVCDAADGDGDNAEATAKRQRMEDDKREESGDSGDVKPTVGGVVLRRPSFKPKPNITPYDRGSAAGKPPYGETRREACPIRWCHCCTRRETSGGRKAGWAWHSSGSTRS
ncbi:uncharacterized protein LOC144173218 [Haemaphysalis longicornis]